MRVIFCYLALICLFKGYSQQSTFVGPIIHDKNYQIRENIVLETDRNIYLAGEELFISCTTYEPLLHQILTLSSVIYVELFTSENLVIEQLKISCKEGQAEGSFIIPRQLASGRYHIRAYTNYMKNFGAEAFTYRSVTVINPFEEYSYEKDDTIIPSLKSLDIYPEGGTLIYNHDNRVVCKFKSSEGFPVIALARVLDKDNNILTSFATNEYGMGAFNIIPQAGNRYKIEAVANNVTVLKNIEVNEKGCVLRKIYQDEDQLQFMIQANKETEYPFQLELSYSNTTINIPYNPDSLISISTKNLPSGIIQFRLRDGRDNIISFRSVFIPPVTSDLYRTATNKNNYANREIVELEVKKNHNVTIEPQNISISVFMIAENSMNYFIAEDKLLYFQSVLYPNLNGHQYSAYKIARDTSLLEDILLTLEPFKTISFQYNKMEYLPERKYDLISGSVVKDDTIPVAFSPVIQTWMDTISMMQTTTTDENGKFLFETKQQGSQILLIRQKNAQGKINVADEFYPEFITIGKEDWHVSKDLKEMLEQQSVNLQINDSYDNIMTYRQNEVQIPFYFKADNHYKISDFVSLPMLKDFLFEVVPEVMVTESRGRINIRMHFPLSDMPFGNDPLFLVDGIPVFDAEVIGRLKCMDIISLDIIKEKYFYKNENFDGIIDIHTKAKDASILGIPEGLFYDDFTGVQRQLAHDRFSLPDKSSNAPFFRTQLYWNPGIKSSGNDKTVISFYAPDNKGEYLVRIGCMNSGGLMDYSYTTFTVR